MTGLEKIRDNSHNETMNFSLHFSRIFAAFLLVISFISPEANAVQFTVKKAKGNSAVIETDVPLEEGQTYQIAESPVSENVDYKSANFKPRQNSLSFGAEFESVRSDLSQNTQFTGHLRYGWNFSSLEVGLSLSMSTSDRGAGATNDFVGGGYFDYNLVNNRDPRSFIYGPFVLVGTGTTQYPSSATGGSSTRIVSNLGGFMTMFLGNSNTAVRAEGFYDYQQINTTNQQNSVAGFGARALLVLYF